jgi:predicted outer membrane repeat protein
VLVVCAPLAADVIRVDADAPAGGDGTSWETAFRFLRDAIAVASLGDELRIAEGTYLPDRTEAEPEGTGDRAASFTLHAGFTLAGGYAGLGADDPDERDVELYETILSGDLAGNDDGFEHYDDNAQHLIVGELVPGLVTLDGLSIVAANNTDVPTTFGGAVRCLESTIIVDECTFRHTRGTAFVFDNGQGLIADCRFVENVSDDHAGALWMRHVGIAVANSVFERNTAPTQGGAVYASSISRPVSFSNCEFTNNTTGWNGGAVWIRAGGFGGAPVQIDSCTFRDNTASGETLDGDGGGLYADDVLLLLTRSRFIGNSALRYGGGVWVDPENDSRVERCIFIDNEAIDFDGGAVNWRHGRGTFENSLFSGNRAGRDGGGVIFSSGPETQPFVNCTVVDNVAGGRIGGLHAQETDDVIAGSIFWGNLDSTGAGEDAQVGTGGESVRTLLYCCVDGWTGTSKLLSGEGVIGDDPRFVDRPGPDGEAGTEDDDLRLRVDSPCIDAGDNMSVPPDATEDLDGAERSVEAWCVPDTGRADGTRPPIDIGAYEHAPSCVADASCDGVVDVVDLAFVLIAWGPCGACAADFNGDGHVDSADLVLLLRDWGPCPG